MLEKISNANFPTDSQGRTYHVSTAPGQTANRILTVGDPARLHRVAKHLDEWPEPFQRVSQRGYTTVTGRYRGVPVSIIAIGMGVAMTDFFVREVRAVVEGELAIIRFGSCGSLDPTLKVGSLGVPEQALTISTNYNHFHSPSKKEGMEPYLISTPIKADERLQKHLFEVLEREAKDDETEVRSIELHASSDCFYSSQGRIDPNFQDDNHELISTLLSRHDKCSSLEMETAHLLHLASIASPSLPIKAAAVHCIFAGRAKEGGSGDFIDPQKVAKLEPKVGKACLDALIGWEIDEKNVTGSRFPQSCLSLLLGLSIGSILAFLLSTPGSSSLLPFIDTLIVLVSYTTATVIIPFSAILLSEILILRTNSNSILFPSLLFSLSGIAQERVGVGRAVWWIQETGELSWIAKLGGRVLVDFVWAAAGFSIARLMYLPFDTSFVGFMIREEEEGEGERDLLQHSEPEEGATQPRPELTERSPFLFPQRITQQSFISIASRRPKHLTKPTSTLSFLLLLQIFSPLFTYGPQTVHHSHPSPLDPEYTYPPVQVGCVALPTHEAGETQMESLLKETRRVAGRGAKVISWSETALRLEEKGNGRRRGKEGWEGMGERERELLTRVGQIAEMYKVYILSTYSLSPNPHSHKSFNIATLLGPSPSNSSQPQILFSTSKHYPIPLIESYSHSARLDSQLLSSPSSLPLISLSLPHAPHTPSPNLTPFQHLSVSTAICQDISFPSLLNSYISPLPSSSQFSSPQLVLNPSNTPSPALAQNQIIQARSRATELSSFILRCDSRSGQSALISPRGEIQAITSGDHGSWEFSLDAESASAGVGGKVWGRKKLGSEFATWCWILMVLVLIEMVGSVERSQLEWIEARGRSVSGWVRGNSQERLIEIEQEEEGGRV
ncbi:hypothetical protein JCM5353_000433 [Sporobolomyces roseus]